MRILYIIEDLEIKTEELKELKNEAQSIAENPRWKKEESEARLLEFFYDTLENMMQQMNENVVSKKAHNFS